jgi:hypothetical protein
MLEFQSETSVRIDIQRVGKSDLGNAFDFALLNFNPKLRSEYASPAMHSLISKPNPPESDARSVET